MSTSPRAFRATLYQEHLEEAAFLYEQRRLLLADPEISWLRLAQFEERLEAHVDALVVGAQQALDICRQRMHEGESGELFAAVCVACRHRDARLLAQVWRALDFCDADRVEAVTAALKWELPASWESACEQAIRRHDGRVSPVLAAVCGYRRIALGDRIGAALLSGSQPAAPEAVWALSRLPVSNVTQQALDACFASDAPPVKAAATLGLLRANQHSVLPTCRAAAATEDWAQLPLGLAGDRGAAGPLRRRVESDTATALTLQALGLLGDVSVVRSLLGCLQNPQLASAATWALFWITGAPLFEKRLEPEAVVEDELFPKELAAWRERGEAPKRADGDPFGVTVRRLSRDMRLWTQWLQEHSSEFQPHVRYRRGKPYSPRAVLDCIEDPAVPHLLRSLAYEELAIRYDCTIPFEADWRVSDQQLAMGPLRQWACDAETRFEPGAWS